MDPSVRSKRRRGWLLIATVGVVGAIAAGAADAAPDTSGQVASPQNMVDALHTAFGKHHARAVHTKGVMLEGEFVPDPGAAKLTMAAIFKGGTLPVTARFSLFAGVPTLPDNDDGASPAGFAFKVRGAGPDFDVEANQHKDFITATSEEFRTFLIALGAANGGNKAPLNAFLASHPHARDFLASRTYPSSYARATYFGVNSVKFTNAQGQSSFVRYRFVPKAGDDYLTPEQRKAQSASYLQDEVLKRVTGQPIVFDWFAQVAERGDRVEDPSIAWPESRKLVKLGTITLNRQPADPEAAQKSLLFLPGQPHPGVEPADAMLKLRNKAYPISFGERQ